MVLFNVQNEIDENTIFGIANQIIIVQFIAHIIHIVSFCDNCSDHIGGHINNWRIIIVSFEWLVAKS